MAACPACGFEYEGSFKFCPECATPLGASTRPIADERKVITALFCDLIGSTALGERLDPEDVDRILRDYERLCRARIESHGGVVDKFIGDAVLGVFGVPFAHEDDPERAVRAGLRIIEDIAASDLDVQVRIGVNTGEVLVRAGVDTRSGEGFATGDALNTASRLQSVAPEMGVVVGLATHEATATVFDYQELDRATLKGKSQPVRIFHAIAPRSRSDTELADSYDTPFVGRAIDLGLLNGIFDKTVAARSAQLVVIVGEPGIGKSRLVAELFNSVHARPEVTTWRQGRCLPYGEGITFWALGEIVKAHAGVLESDPPGATAAKLDAVLAEGEERAWLRQRLLPLLGIEAASSAGREELFTAWRRFLEQIAGLRPTVLVFEDLHWADEAMLNFLEHLTDRAEGVPLLVIATARPELYERHPDFAGALRNAMTINLTPLSPVDTAGLVSALFAATEISPELQQPIVDRAGGNPLYAEEFVHLLKDTGLLVQGSAGWELERSAEVPLPDSVQALIAARLDTLPAERKSMLADAAVVGKVFWAGAVASMGERGLSEVTDALRDLSRKELVRPVRHPSIEGEVEYEFWHVLTRDVSYAHLPRAARASRHVAAARWIESRSPERLEDLAEVLAYHYATALELARAAAETVQAAGLEAPTMKFLTMAGERGLGLDAPAALGNLERALALTPHGHPGRPEALTRFAEAAHQAGRFLEAAQALEEAIESFTARGDLRAQARAMAVLGLVLSFIGDRRWSELPAEAVALLEPLPPGPELASSLTELSRVEEIQGRFESAIRYAERVLALDEELGLGRSARALGYRGLARAELGDPGGLQDMRDAIALAIEAGQGREVGQLHNNLGVELLVFEGPAASLEVLRAGIAFGTARGLTETVNITRASTLGPLFDAGELDEALAAAADMAGSLVSEDVWNLQVVRAEQSHLFALRGQAERVAGSFDGLESTTREGGDPYDIVRDLGSSVLARASLGQSERAAALIAEIEATPLGRETQEYTRLLPAIVRTAVAIGDRALAERLVAGVASHHPYAAHSLASAAAAISEARGDLHAAAEEYGDAADRWERFGVVPEQGFALLGRGRCLLALARSSEAVPALRRAHEIFDRLGAAPALAETDALLQGADPAPA